MPTRRDSDSPQPPRSVIPPAATPARKTAKSVPAERAPLTAVPTGAAATTPAEKTRKRRTTAKKDQVVIAATATPTVSEDERRGMIALSAYLRAERRGFAPEGQAEDWLAAEREVDALLNSGQTKPQ